MLKSVLEVAPISGLRSRFAIAIAKIARFQRTQVLAYLSLTESEEQKIRSHCWRAMFQLHACTTNTPSSSHFLSTAGTSHMKFWKQPSNALTTNEVLEFYPAIWLEVPKPGKQRRFLSQPGTAQSTSDHCVASSHWALSRCARKKL